MNTHTLISRFGSLIAALAIMFLPFIGCEDGEFTGGGIIFNDFVQDIGLRVFLALSLVGAGAVLVLRRSFHHLIAALAGLCSLLVACAMVYLKNEEDTELRYGAFVAMAGFGTTVITALLQFLRQRKEGNAT